MAQVEKQCSCDKYECTIHKSNKDGKFFIWVIVKLLGKIIMAIPTLIWGGNDCEAKKEADKWKQIVNAKKGVVVFLNTQILKDLFYQLLCIK